MNSVMLLLFVIFSSLCSVIYSREFGKITDRIDASNDCLLWVPEKDAPKMPIPFTTNGPRHSIIYPDAKGRLHVGHGRGFKLSCVTGKFASAELRNVSEVLVSCAGKDRLRYRGNEYKYEDFRCDAMPKSRLTVTDETCQPQKYAVAAVGFQTKNHFLRLYSVCFDKWNKNALYTWYDARSPYYDNHQKDSARPQFAKTKELYGNTDVNKKYTVNEQRKTLAKILKSDKLADKYIKDDNKHSMSRGHYAAKADFFFAHEQSATFYYANVAPQWQTFNDGLWAKLEKKMRRRLSRDTGAQSSARRVIVTGTYGSCTLPDVDGVQRSLFLDPPHDIPVPLFYWKLDYDADARDGLVYVGLNDPYREIDDSVYLCPNVCPNGFDADDNDKNDDEYEDGYGGGNGKSNKDANQGLVYCCTMESFERVYGLLDPIVFSGRND